MKVGDRSTLLAGLRFRDRDPHRCRDGDRTIMGTGNPGESETKDELETSIQEHTPSGRVQDYREFSVKCTVGAIVNPVALLLQVLHD
ncbi:MAG: hypothetical protein CME24_13190 [Gemmatimonadetes bacterium]|nr:hypothetical protein [Gemmatimonadota bacterium]